MTPITLIVIAGLMLRVCAAIIYPDIIYPDEHFQVLEPASWVTLGYGWKSWEWYHGVRNWFVPGLYMPILALLKWVGIDGGPTAVAVCRAYTAVASSTILMSFAVLLKNFGFSLGVRTVSVALLAFCPALVVWAGSTFSETWAAIFLWAAIAAMSSSKKERSFFWGGVLLGLSVVARLQMLAWVMGVAAFYLLISRPSRKSAIRGLIGFAIPLLGLAVLDTATWGAPFYSAYKNIRMNIFEGVAAMNGVHPWYDYFPRMWRNLGAVFATMLGVSVLALGLKKFRPGRRELFIFLPSLIFLIAHILIGHKEARFIVPLYPALFFAFAYVLHRAEERHLVAFQHLSSSTQSASMTVACVAAMTSVWPQLYSPAHFDGSDLSRLALAMYRDGGLKKHPESCLLLVDHYFIWSRGELMQGQKLTFKDVRVTDLKPQDLRTCGYAMVRYGSTERFQQVARNWTPVASDPVNNVLYRNDELMK